MLKDHFTGTFLGTLIGDVLGKPFEGATSKKVESIVATLLENAQKTSGKPLAKGDDEHRSTILAALIAMGKGRYTDDTQLTIALAEALLDTPGSIDIENVAFRFKNNFDTERGYGGTTWNILDSMNHGYQWQNAINDFGFPGGSYGNGAAMRVAPVALAFFGDESKVNWAAEVQARVTGHTHPSAVFGARMQALAVHQALMSATSSKPFNGPAFIEKISDQAPDDFIEPLNWIRDNLDSEPAAVQTKLGCGIHAAESVPTALWCFLSCMDDPIGAILRAIHLGGDTDTIAAMTGALAGAYHGTKFFPDDLINSMENEEAGCDYIVYLATKLFENKLGVK